MTTAELCVWTTSELAGRFRRVDPRVSEHIVRATMRRIGLGLRKGRYTLLADDDVPNLELGLKARGYLAPSREPGGAVLSRPGNDAAPAGLDSGEGCMARAADPRHWPDQHPSQEDVIRGNGTA